MPLWMMDTMHAPKWQLGVAFLPCSISYLVGTNVFGPLGYRIGRWRSSMIGLVLSGCCLWLVSENSRQFPPISGLKISLHTTDPVRHWNTGLDDSGSRARIRDRNGGFDDVSHNGASPEFRNCLTTTLHLITGPYCRYQACLNLRQCLRRGRRRLLRQLRARTRSGRRHRAPRRLPLHAICHWIRHNMLRSIVLVFERPASDKLRC